jgi:hypothetical protein
MAGELTGKRYPLRQVFRSGGSVPVTPTLLFTKNDTVIFTKKYVRHTLLSKKTYDQGESGIITRVYKGVLGCVTHLDVRFPDGEFVREVPIDNFKA